MKSILVFNVLTYVLSTSLINMFLIPSQSQAKSIAPHSVVFLQYHRVGEEHIRKKSTGRVWTNIQEFQFLNHLNYMDGKNLSVNTFKRDTYCNSIESKYSNEKNTQEEKVKNIHYREKKRTAYLAKKQKQNKKPGTAWKSCVIKQDTKLYKKPNFAFSVIPMEKAISHLVNKENFNSNSVVITVDDPYRSFYTYGFPHLKKRNLPFTFFINTDIIDTNNHKPVAEKKLGILTWNELRTITEYKGTTIGCHTADHAHMIEHSIEKNFLTVLKCMTRIKEELGVSPRTFSYPYGESTVALRTMLSTFSVEDIEIMSDKYNSIKTFVNKTLQKHSADFFNDFKVDAAFGQHSSPASFIPKSANIKPSFLKSSSSDLYNLPRFALNEKYGAMNSFVDKVSSLGMPIIDVKFNNLQEDNIFLQKSEETALKEIQFSIVRNIIKYSYLNACYVWNKAFLIKDKELPPLSRKIFDDKISFKIAIDKIYNRSRRERINCTFARKDNRFYWFGLQLSKYYKRENRNHKPNLLPEYLLTKFNAFKRSIASQKINNKKLWINTPSLKQRFHNNNPLK
ncbi:MAG: polysaccharide deacetylase family protein [Bdellovibrionaceae bacterium]|nr:polysaccharide deacetylase family protein [Pseudobdellovibrionaceae bacterium]